jgi:unsaturated chondroitin disaccharide hydrolase
MSASLDAAWRFVLAKIDENLDRLGDRFPLMTVDGAWQPCTRDDWVEGYWPGMLWLAHDATEAPRHLLKARRLSTLLAPRAYDVNTPPLSMVFYPSCVYGYRRTGDAAMREVALNGARSMAARFNERAGFIELTWAPPDEALKQGRTIVDTMLNLSLLWWAGDVAGDQRLSRMATRSTDAVLRNHVRPDYSTYHVVYADPETNEPVRQEAGQGYQAESCWSRGQAWAIYGFALAYRETHDPRYLEAARGLADYYLARLPADLIPYWDFQAPNVPDEPRDSSAAAIAACGLLDLADLTGDRGWTGRYAEAGRATIESLAAHYTSDGQPSEQGILLHAVYHRPRNHGVDCSLIWGDFYYMKALAKLRRPSS